MKNKIIGITSRSETVDGFDKEFVYQNYIDALLNYKCNPIILPLNNPHIQETLDICDGFLVTGGADISPIFYGESDEGTCKNTLKAVDELDKNVISYAVKNKKPLLGICRGLQALNIFTGGTLYQDIGTTHSKIKDGHEIISLKNGILPFDEKFYANSYHHQAIKKLADGLTPIAYHDDVIEAVVSETLPFIAVQWHPERIFNTKESKMIFDKFFEYVNKNE